MSTKLWETFGQIMCGVRRPSHNTVKVLAVSLLAIGFAPLTYSQQTAPKDILPPTAQKSTISPTLAVTTPSNVSELSPLRTSATPQAPAAPAVSTPELPMPALVETTNTVVTAPNPVQPVAPSLWNGTNGVNSSAWDKSAASAVAPTPTAKPAANPWAASPASSRTWDTAAPVNTGTKTEWK